MKRRSFLKLGTGTVLGSALTACGHGSDDSPGGGQVTARPDRTYSNQLKPSRASRAKDSDGPQVPAA